MHRRAALCRRHFFFLQKRRALQLLGIAAVCQFRNAQFHRQTCQRFVGILCRKIFHQRLIQRFVRFGTSLRLLCGQFFLRLPAFAKACSHAALGGNQRQTGRPRTLSQTVCIRVQQSRHAEPIGKAGRILRYVRHGTALPLQPQRQLGQIAFRAFDRRRNKQLIACARQGNVQNAHFLTDGFLFLQQTHGALRHRGKQPALLTQSKPHAQLRVKHHRLISVAHIKFPSAFRQKYHGKFQPFGAMNGHNRHTALCQHGRRACHGSAAFQHMVYRAQKRRQPILPCCAGKGGESPQVFTPHRAVFHGANCRKIMGARQNFLAQNIHRLRCRQTAQRVQKCGQALHSLVLTLQQCAIERRFRACQAQSRQIIGQKAKHRRQHRTRQRHVFGGVVNHTQQTKQRRGLRAGNRVFPRIGTGWNAAKSHGRFVSVKVAARTQQNTKVTKIARACRPALFAHQKALSHHLHNAPGNHLRVARLVAVIVFC